MKKLVCILLTFAMLLVISLTLVGCGGRNDDWFLGELWNPEDFGRSGVAIGHIDFWENGSMSGWGVGANVVTRWRLASNGDVIIYDQGSNETLGRFVRNSGSRATLIHTQTGQREVFVQRNR